MDSKANTLPEQEICKGLEEIPSTPNKVPSIYCIFHLPGDMGYRDKRERTAFLSAR